MQATAQMMQMLQLILLLPTSRIELLRGELHTLSYWQGLDGEGGQQTRHQAEPRAASDAEALSLGA